MGALQIAQALERRALTQSRERAEQQRKEAEKLAQENAEREARRKARADENRRRMPIVAKITDQMREVFSNLKEVRSNEGYLLRAETIHEVFTIDAAEENGLKIGSGEFDDCELVGRNHHGVRIVTKRKET